MCGHCPDAFVGNHGYEPKIHTGLSREEFLLRHGPDEAKAAILSLRADAARAEEGDAVHEPEHRPAPSSDTAGGDVSGLNDQPPPQPGDQVVWPIAQRQFEDTLLGQVHKGLVKYDTTLQSFNGRDPYADLLQEKVDDLMYTTQLYLEAQAFVQLTVRAVQLMERVLDDWTPERPTPLERDLETLRYEMKKCLKQSGLSQSQNPSQT